jgi:hypothetical protein
LRLVTIFHDIVGWGEHHLDFRRRFSAFHSGIPRALAANIGQPY